MIALLSLVLLCFDLPACPSTYRDLISQLGSRSYRSREAAESQLRLAFPACRCALALAVASEDPEVSSRCRSLLEACLEPPEPMPWIDMLPPEPSGWRNHVESSYLHRARDFRVFYHIGPDWPEYRQATRLFCRDLFWCGIRRELVEAMLRTMRWREGEYRRKHGLSMSGSAE